VSALLAPCSRRSREGHIISNLRLFAAQAARRRVWLRRTSSSLGFLRKMDMKRDERAFWCLSSASLRRPLADARLVLLLSRM
jgi:hypothetical protein